MFSLSYRHSAAAVAALAWGLSSAQATASSSHGGGGQAVLPGESAHSGEPERAPLGLTIGAKLGVAAGSPSVGELGGSWGLHAGYAPLRWLRVGLDFHRSEPTGNDGERLVLTSLSALVELHPVDFVIDPYFAGHLGWAHAQPGWGYDGFEETYPDEHEVAFGWAVGADVVIGDTVALGPQFRGLHAGEFSTRAYLLRLEVRF